LEQLLSYFVDMENDDGMRRWVSDELFFIYSQLIWTKGWYSMPSTPERFRPKPRKIGAFTGTNKASRRPVLQEHKMLTNHPTDDALEN